MDLREMFSFYLELWAGTTENDGDKAAMAHTQSNAKIFLLIH